MSPTCPRRVPKGGAVPAVKRPGFRAHIGASRYGSPFTRRCWWAYRSGSDAELGDDPGDTHAHGLGSHEQLGGDLVLVRPRAIRHITSVSRAVSSRAAAGVASDVSSSRRGRADLASLPNSSARGGSESESRLSQSPSSDVAAPRIADTNQRSRELKLRHGAVVDKPAARPPQPLPGRAGLASPRRSARRHATSNHTDDIELPERMQPAGGLRDQCPQHVPDASQRLACERQAHGQRRLVIDSAPRAPTEARHKTRPAAIRPPPKRKGAALMLQSTVTF
jgi:hypothetical protein